MDDGETCDDGKRCDTPTAEGRVPCTSDAQCGTFVLCKPLSGDGCNAQCQEEFCGDGVTQPGRGEQCDLGGYCQIPGQPACTSRNDCPINPRTGMPATCAPVNLPECKSCISNTCGDGITQPNSYQCDDGKHCKNGTKCSDDSDCYRQGLSDSSCTPRSGDGCSSQCTPEFCGDGVVVNEGKCPDGSLCTKGEQCADGTSCKPAEDCDEKGVASATCNEDCTRAICGDKKVNPAYFEQCDDGMHCADGTECNPGSSCSDGSACEARGPADGKAYGIATCSKSCRALKPTKCCSCYYEEHPECTGRPKDACSPRECSDGIDNDGDGKIDADDDQCDNSDLGKFDASESEVGRQADDCKWDGVLLKCRNMFEMDCENDFRKNACDTERMLPITEPKQPYPDSLVCTATKDFQQAHSESYLCNAYMQDVQSCVTCSTATCQRYVNSGCRTFANIGDARAGAQAIQATMRLRGIRMVYVEGHQMLASPTCSSLYTLKITQQTITEEYGFCKFGNYCYMTGESYKCKDEASGSIVDGVCCRGGILDHDFVRTRAVGTPPACPGEPNRMEGQESAAYSHPSCSSAQSAAWRDAHTKIAAKQVACLAAHPAGTFSNTCDVQRISSSWIPPQCSMSVVCDWTCSW